ncbi:MAG: hypothetical protein M1575_00785 [Patescibacteria group bacterium]|nr:hypothetical protein [Patescibacteria group bacterium]MCL5095259.1 hypothetical protein [Patescibacteria group bacterium]
MDKLTRDRANFTLNLTKRKQRERERENRIEKEVSIVEDNIDKILEIKPKEEENEGLIKLRNFMKPGEVFFTNSWDGKTPTPHLFSKPVEEIAAELKKPVIIKVSGLFHRLLI